MIWILVNLLIENSVSCVEGTRKKKEFTLLTIQCLYFHEIHFFNVWESEESWERSVIDRQVLVILIVEIIKEGLKKF